MSQFKVGDRVRVTEHYIGHDAGVGQVGTVLEESGAPWVVFDDPTGYGPAPSEGDPDGWREGHMDCISEELLALAETPTPQHDPGRRERIATAVLAGFASRAAASDMGADWKQVVAREARDWADALIAELDR